MPASPDWYDIALRLFLTVVAGTVIGIDRSERGRPAGLRTTLLVCLAASISMIQANLLLDTHFRRQDSFVSLDVMRLPLGILSGMGFIGAGAILKKGDLVLGITTAATLWIVTVIGLCFGGGQITLGLITLGMAVLVLSGLRQLENWLPRYHRALLTMTLNDDGPSETAVCGILAQQQFHTTIAGVFYNNAAASHCLELEVQWKTHSESAGHPSILTQLRQMPGVLELRWQPDGFARAAE